MIKESDVKNELFSKKKHGGIIYPFNQIFIDLIDLVAPKRRLLRWCLLWMPGSGSPRDYTL